MTTDFLQFALFLGLLVALALLLGAYMAATFAGSVRFLAPLELALLKAAGPAAQKDQRWTSYALALLAFNAAGFALLFLVLIFQDLSLIHI